MATTKTTYLITGANRGIGLALTAIFLARPNTIVIAGVRSTSILLGPFAALKRGLNSEIHMIHFDALDTSDLDQTMQELRESNVTSIDVVIADAGMAPKAAFKSLADVDLDQVRRHVTVNSIGPLALYQATRPFLLASTVSEGPKFVLLGSLHGHIGSLEDFSCPTGTFGASKALAHYFIRKIHLENDRDRQVKRLIAWVLDPGEVRTKTGNELAKVFGHGSASVEIDESATWISKQIDEATHEKTGGQFISYSKGNIDW